MKEYLRTIYLPEPKTTQIITVPQNDGLLLQRQLAGRRNFIKSLAATAALPMFPEVVTSGLQETSPTVSRLQRANFALVSFISELLNKARLLLEKVQFIATIGQVIHDNYKEILGNALKEAIGAAYKTILCKLQQKGYTLHLDVNKQLQCAPGPQNQRGIFTGFGFRSLTEPIIWTPSKTSQPLSVMIAGHPNNLDTRINILRMINSKNPFEEAGAGVTHPTWTSILLAGIPGRNGIVPENERNELQKIGLDRTDQRGNNLFKFSLLDIETPDKSPNGGHNGPQDDKGQLNTSTNEFEESWKTRGGYSVVAIYRKEQEWKWDGEKYASGLGAIRFDITKGEKKAVLTYRLKPGTSQV